MLYRTLKMAFWVYYDHLGKLLVVNILWALVAGLPGAFGVAALLTDEPGVILFVGAPVLALTLGVLLPVASAGLAHMTCVLIESRDGSIRDFFAGIRLYGLKATGIGLFYVSALVCLPVSAWFYAGSLQATAPWLGYALAAAALWALLFLCLTSLLVLPALVQKKAGAVQAVKLAALLVLDNPVFALGLAGYALALGALSLIPPLLFLASGSAMLALQSSAYEMLARKYAALRLEREGGPPPERPIHTVSRGGRLVFDDAQDDYLNRGFRDLLFPWKG